MSKTELLAEMTRRGIPASRDWSVVELKSILAEDDKKNSTQDALPKGLTGMKLEELVQEAKKVGLAVGSKETRGSLMRRLRDHHRTPDETLMTVGRFKGIPYYEVPETYGKWASDEERANHDNMHPDLMRFVKWRRAARQRSLEESSTHLNDPEVNAKVPPPPISETGYSAGYASSASWDLIQEHGTLPIAPKSRAKVRDKRAGPSIPAATRMEQDVGADVTEEIQALETRLAVLRDRNALHRQA
jgi:HAMP domain-containing protein